MKTLIALVLRFVFCSFSFGQSFQMATASALVLPAEEKFIGYSFPFTPSQYEWWNPTQHNKAKTPCFIGFCDKDKAQFDFIRVETNRAGISYVWLTDSHDFCSPEYQP